MTRAREPRSSHTIELPAQAERAKRRARRQRWLNIVLLAIFVPMVLATWMRLGPLMGAPLRMAMKLVVLALPLVGVLVVLHRLRRR